MHEEKKTSSPNCQLLNAKKICKTKGGAWGRRGWPAAPSGPVAGCVLTEIAVLKWLSRQSKLKSDTCFPQRIASCQGLHYEEGWGADKPLVSLLDFCPLPHGWAEFSSRLFTPAGFSLSQVGLVTGTVPSGNLQKYLGNWFCSSKMRVLCNGDCNQKEV